MKIALCQMENKGSVQENLEGSLRAVREAASQHADLILFPEVQLTEFFPQYPGKDVSRYRVRNIRSWWCRIFIWRNMGKPMTRVF